LRNCLVKSDRRKDGRRNLKVAVVALKALLQQNTKASKSKKKEPAMVKEHLQVQIQLK
jgi:hypothetical protein